MVGRPVISGSYSGSTEKLRNLKYLLLFLVWRYSLDLVELKPQVSPILCSLFPVHDNVFVVYSTTFKILSEIKAVVALKLKYAAYIQKANISKIY